MAQRAVGIPAQPVHHAGKVFEVAFTADQLVECWIREQTQSHLHSSAVAPPRRAMRRNPADLAALERQSAGMESFAQGELNRPVAVPAQLQDRRFWSGDREGGAKSLPHLTQQLARMGARIVFHAVNGGGRGDSEQADLSRSYHEANLRMRAQAGKLWIVTVDSCHPTDRPCSSPSGVVGPDGSWAVKTDQLGEQLFVHTIESAEE